MESIPNSTYIRLEQLLKPYSYSYHPWCEQTLSVVFAVKHVQLWFCKKDIWRDNSVFNHF